MEFRKYEKIHRLGKEETEGILEGLCYVQEKIDGANTSIWLEEGQIQGGSRSRYLGGDDFNGFTPYIQKHEGIRKLLSNNPTWRLYGEWLVRHTISYNNLSYKKFYLFDIWDGEQYFNTETVNLIGKEYGIDTPQFFGVFENPSVDQLNEFVGKTTLGEKGEGIVIKNRDFKDKFGDNHSAKIVTQEFKEDNGVMFGGNNKSSDTYWEMVVVNKYVDVPRVQKIMNKIQPEINERLDMKHIPRICGTVYHDVITEEAWEIASKVQRLDYKALQRVMFKKIKQVYVDLLEGNLSVADTNEKKD